MKMRKDIDDLVVEIAELSDQIEEAKIKNKKKLFLYVVSAVTVSLRFSVMTALQFISSVVI